MASDQPPADADLDVLVQQLEAAWSTCWRAATVCHNLPARMDSEMRAVLTSEDWDRVKTSARELDEASRVVKAGIDALLAARTAQAQAENDARDVLKASTENLAGVIAEVDDLRAKLAAAEQQRDEALRLAADYIDVLENAQDGYYRASESADALAWHKFYKEITS